MKTGMELITQIGELSSMIAENRRVGASTVSMENERERLRKELQCLPDLSLT